MRLHCIALLAVVPHLNMKLISLVQRQYTRGWSRQSSHSNQSFVPRHLLAVTAATPPPPASNTKSPPSVLTLEGEVTKTLPLHYHNMAGTNGHLLLVAAWTALLPLVGYVIFSVYCNRVKIYRLRKAGYVRPLVPWSLDSAEHQ
jgi:hypothetical protein